MEVKNRKARTVRTKAAATVGPRASASVRREEERDPSVPSLWYPGMAERWMLVADVIGGTETMRAARERRLPQHPEETDDSWQRRLDQAVLFNVMRMTVETLAGYPFSEPIVLQPDVPQRIRDACEDIDLRGTHIDVFAKQWFIEALAKGFAHVLVDHPPVKPREDGQPRTLADDKAEGLRPYWVLIRPEDLIGARGEIIDGREVLTHIRYRQTVMSIGADGFTETAVEQIVVREPGTVQVWTRQDEGQRVTWVPGTIEPVTLPGGRAAPITLVTLYTARDGFMACKPPLEDLAHLNVTHWQSYADQRNILSVARFPMLAASGVEDDGGVLAVGPNQMLMAEDPQARYYYVEHSGKAIEAGRVDLQDLEARMSAYGADFLKKRPTVYTATGRILDQNGIFSPLQMMTISARDAIETALDFTALWMGESEGGSVKLNTEFAPHGYESADLAALESAWLEGLISDETYLGELQRRKTITPDLDLKKELAGVEARREQRQKEKAAARPAPQPGRGAAPNSGGSKPQG